MLWFFILHTKKRTKEPRALLSDYNRLKAELEKSRNNEKILADLCNGYQNIINTTLDACMEACSDDTISKNGTESKKNSEETNN